MIDILRRLYFQFHKGTIKTKPAENVITALMYFQFHKGTIKT